MEIVQQMALQLKVFRIFWGCADLSFYWMKSHKNLHTKYMLLEKRIVQLLCAYLTRGRFNSVFSKILLIVISRLVVNGIAHFFFFYTRCILLEKTLVQFLCTYLARERLNNFFFQNSFDNHISASVA